EHGIPLNRVRWVTIDPRTPVLVGQAQVLQHEDDISRARGPIELMSDACTKLSSMRAALNHRVSMQSTY
ncbi:MAG: hypothetical protein ACKOEK_00115, partial [Actinomycetota bacterium]